MAAIFCADIIEVSSQDHAQATGLKFQLKVGHGIPHLKSLAPRNTLMFKWLGWYLNFSARFMKHMCIVLNIRK
jgi:hypothetical protein